MTTKPAQPAPAGATAAPASGTAAGATKVNHSPSEVAWMFVREYYHYLNRDPSRLHLFYGKDSAAIHGMEGDHADPAHGQAEIQKMLAAQSFKEARVVISSVDSLLSVNDGVVVQVLGELSNAGNPSQKFVQTFFLAKQPAGFFVLNDVFRYLCEDVEDEGADLDSAPIQQHHVAAAPESAAPAAPTVVEKANKPKSREPSPVKPKSPERRRPVSPAPAAAAPEPVAAPALVEQAKPRALSPAPAAAAQPSQAVTPAEQKPKSREPSPKRAKSPGKPAAAEPVAAEPKKEQAKPATAAPAPAQRAKSPAKPAPPAKPATWATLAAKAPAASSSTGSSPAPTPAPPAGASPRSQSPAVSSAAAPAEPVVRAVDSTPAAAPTASSSALQVYGSPGQESQQPGGRNPNFHVDVDKSVYLRLPYPAFETATPEFLVSSLPAGVTVKAITYQRQAAVLHLGSAEEAKAVLGTKLTMNGNTTTVEVRREGGAPGGRTGYGSGQGYRGGYQGGMGRGGSYGGGAQGAGPRPGSSGGVPRGAGGYGGAQQGSGEFGGRGGAMGGRGGRGRGGAAPARA